MAQLKKTTSIKLNEDLDKRLSALAQKRDRSPHYIMHSAIQDFIEREEKIEKFREETIKTYEEYALTGHYINNLDAMNWLENLENGIVTEPPK